MYAVCLNSSVLKENQHEEKGYFALFINVKVFLKVQ